MTIGLFINDVATERAAYATTTLAAAALARGHRVVYIGVEDFAYDPDERLRARAVVLDEPYDDNDALLEALQSGDHVQRLAVSDVDVLLLRNNPADDADGRAWAQSAGIIFGQMAVREGVVVLNDPLHLGNALNKLYFQTFPEEVRPKTLITRDRDEIRAFCAEQPSKAVLKPLQGSGGQNVFVIGTDDLSNLNQIVEAIARDGYVVAQEYLPAAAEGDLRLFLMNGEPLQVDGRYAAFRRLAPDDDVRSNMSAGGEAEQAEVDDVALHIASLVRPKLIRDGMFLVGLDIAGDRLMEVNVFSPGGLTSMERLEGVSFSGAVVEALERKIAHAERYHGRFDNVQLATM